MPTVFKRAPGFSDRSTALLLGWQLAATQL